jgi:D-alanyl-D-alanine carboxypeptidase/D-alanyl-D-alanine-endopeptidase (penicillin-binding protein 4)
MTANNVMDVVSYIYAHPELGLIDTLAEAGKSGTLKYRVSLRHPPLAGQVKGKTGTLFSTYNIAGIIETKSKTPLLFVQMVTGYYYPEHHKHAKKEIRRFENKFYMDLFENK